MDSFLILAMGAGLMLAAVAAPLGCLVLWRRADYFGDTIAHAALTGVALSLFLKIEVLWGVAFVTIATALMLGFSRARPFLSPHTRLAILSPSLLAIGLVLLGQVRGPRLDLNAYLFGDILSVTVGDVWIVLLTSVPLLGIMYFLWKPLLNLAINRDLAIIDGVRARVVDVCFFLSLALFMSVALKVFGALLASALLILPAGIARTVSRTPLQMALKAIIVGVFMVCGGTVLSLYADVPTAPMIVIVGFFVFILSHLKR